MLRIICLDEEECGFVSSYKNSKEDFNFTCPDCGKIAVLMGENEIPLLFSNKKEELDKLLVYVYNLLRE